MVPSTSTVENQVKRYGIIFSCLHLEVAAFLDTDSFINTLCRFITRRGQALEMHIDNGTNFVGLSASRWRQYKNNRTRLATKRNPVHRHHIKVKCGSDHHPFQQSKWCSGPDFKSPPAAEVKTVTTSWPDSRWSLYPPQVEACPIYIWRISSGRVFARAKTLTKVCLLVEQTWCC